MSVSATPITASSTPSKSLSSSNSGDNQSKQPESGTSRSSADPRPSNKLSPRSADAVLNVSISRDTSSSMEKTNSKSKTNSETTYHTAGYDLNNDGEIILPEQSVTTPSNSPGSGDGLGSTAGTTAPGGGGGGGGGGGSTSASASGGTPSVVDDGDHSRISFQEASATTYQSLFSENPRGARIGDENQGAVAVGEHSGTSSDGSIWSEGKIIFKTEKGVFWASPSVPGDVIFARMINGSLDITSGHKAYS